MLLGKEVRLNRLFNQKDGNILTVAMDHGIAFSYKELPQGLEKIDRVLPDIVAGNPDAVVFQKGMAESYWRPYAGQIPWMLQTMVFAPHIVNIDHQVAWLEDAVALGADAIAMTITVGDDGQGRETTMLADLVTQARSVGMPVVAHIYAKGDQVPSEEAHSLPWVRYAARVGAELGVDIVKISYTGETETFAQVVETCPVPVVAAGGPRLNSVEDVLHMVRGVMDAGAKGVTIGRNVWGDENVPAIMEALQAIIHNGASAEAALDIYRAG